MQADVTLETVEDFAEEVRLAKGMPALPTYRALMLYGVCPSLYFTRLSYEAARVFSACGGTSRLSTPAQYYDLPAVYVDACATIDSKIGEIKKLRESNRE